MSNEEAVHLLSTADATPVGTIGFDAIDWRARTAELGYWVAPDHHGQGYGTEAAELIVAYGFEQLGLHRISARVFAFDEPSIRLLERGGVRPRGRPA